MTTPTVPGFDRQWTGAGPHYEVWYGKLDLGPGRAFWFRYTILDGHTREASTWAILFDKGQIHAGREVFEPEDLAPDQTFSYGNASLTTASAQGRAGRLAWDLTWADRGRRAGFVPPLVKRLAWRNPSTTPA